MGEQHSDRGYGGGMGGGGSDGAGGDGLNGLRGASGEGGITKGNSLPGMGDGADFANRMRAAVGLDPINWGNIRTMANDMQAADPFAFMTSSPYSQAFAQYQAQVRAEEQRRQQEAQDEAIRKAIGQAAVQQNPLNALRAADAVYSGHLNELRAMGLGDAAQGLQDTHVRQYGGGLLGTMQRIGGLFGSDSPVDDVRTRSEDIMAGVDSGFLSPGARTGEFSPTWKAAAYPAIVAAKFAGNMLDPSLGMMGGLLNKALGLGESIMSPGGGLGLGTSLASGLGSATGLPGIGAAAGMTDTAMKMGQLGRSMQATGNLTEGGPRSGMGSDGGGNGIPYERYLPWFLAQNPYFNPGLYRG